MQWRGKIPPFCPVCRETWLPHKEFINTLADAPQVIIRLSAEDFPRKPRGNPNQAFFDFVPKTKRGLL